MKAQQGSPRQKSVHAQETIVRHCHPRMLRGYAYDANAGSEERLGEDGQW